jgi:hypothetical protein
MDKDLVEIYAYGSDTSGKFFQRGTIPHRNLVKGVLHPAEK